MSAAAPSNSAFMRAVLGALEPWQFGWVCTFAGDPHQAAPAVWAGRTYRGTPAQGAILDRAAGQNAYYSAAVLQAAPGGDVQRSKAAFARLAVLLADDMDVAQLQGTPTYILETSPGKHQVGVIVDPADPDAADIGLVDQVLAEMARRDGRDPAGNACVRFARLPVGINGKGGAAHRVQLLQWNPDNVMSLADAAAVLGIDVDQLRHQGRRDRNLSDFKPDPLVRSMQGVPEGMRDDVMFKHAASLRARNMERDEAEVLILERASRCTPPFPPQEALKCLDSAWRYPPGKSGPQESGAFELQPPARLDWERLPANPPEVPFVIPGWMPANVVTLLAAHGGTGKSFISLLIALSLATGRHPFTGEGIPPARVVLYSAEDGMAVMQLRLRRLIAMLHVDEAELQGQLDILDATEADNVLFVDAGRDGGKTTARFDWLREHCQAFGAEVLIFDNASDAYGADENNRALVRQFLSALRRIAPTVLLLSHVDAGSSMADPRDAKGYSGSTAWHNSARSRWFMAREKNDDVLLRVPKSNYAAAGVEATLRWDDQNKVFAVVGVRHGQPKAKDCAPIILALLREQLAAGAEVSPAINAANSVHNLLKHDPRYPSNVRPADVGAMARQWINTGQVSVEEYPRRNRSMGQRLRIPRPHTVAHGLEA